MFDETPTDPAELAAIAESAPVRRTRKAGGQKVVATHLVEAASDLIADGHIPRALHTSAAACNPIVSEAANIESHLTNAAPLADYPSILADEPESDLAPYAPTEAVTEAVASIIRLHRLRQGMIKAQTKLTLQAMASIRFVTQQSDDYDSDEAKAKARKRSESLYRTVLADPTHELHANIRPYLLAIDPLDAQRALYEKEMVRLVKHLPVYEWAKAVKGLGDVSLATIVGECGDIGTYRSFSAIWKRLGLAVIGGKRQGAPGVGATAEEWILHGYNPKRRSVSWNARNNLIGGMGKYRPVFGEDVNANPDLTYLQKVFVERARYEAAGFCHFKKKDGSTVFDENGEIVRIKRIEATGKESYSAHAANRAMRYTEKRMLKKLYQAWRRA